MLLTTFASVLFALGTTAAIPHNKRETYTGQTVYVYGAGILALPVLTDSSGLAYVSSATSTNYTSITWDINTGTVPWNVTALNTTTTFTTGTFYIVTSADAYSPAGFVASNATAPTGAETTGFTLYGSDVSFISGDIYQEQFWATPISDTDWVIYWNVNGSSVADSVPVTLKISTS